jgi:hypothetical protein
MVKESGYGRVRMVPLHGTGAGAPLQELSALEEAAEDAVGGRAAGDWKGEEPLHDPGPFRG